METDLKKIVGQRLQLLRMEKNLTQEQMAKSSTCRPVHTAKLNMGKLT